MESPFDKYTDEYEDWFARNRNLFQSELLALQQMVPQGKIGVEIGVGTGIFAEKLGIRHGIDPSESMLALAKKRGLTVKKGFAESLPFDDKSFDFVVFVTSICFICNPEKAFGEAYRVVRDKGELIVAFIDKNGRLGQSIETSSDKGKFYQDARFYSVDEIYALFKNNGFSVTETVQTLTNLDNNNIELPMEGYGKGSFVVIKGKKNL